MIAHTQRLARARRFSPSLLRPVQLGPTPPPREEDSEDEIIALDDDSEPEIIAIDGPVITEAPKGAAPSVPKELCAATSRARPPCSPSQPRPWPVSAASVGRVLLARTPI